MSRDRKNLKAKLIAPHNIHDVGLSEVLIGDVKAARQSLKRSESDYARRTYVRTVFAAIEGYITIIRGRAMLAHAPGRKSLTVADFAILREETYIIENGKSATKPRFNSIGQTFQFSIMVFQKAWMLPEKVHTDCNGFRAFKAAVLVRNRITHPRQLSEMTVSKKEIEDASLAYKFVRYSVTKAMADTTIYVQQFLEHGTVLVDGVAKAKVKPSRNAQKIHARLQILAKECGIANP